MIILIRVYGEDKLAILKEAREEIDVILAQKKADKTISEGGLITDDRTGDIVATFSVDR